MTRRDRPAYEFVSWLTAEIGIAKRGKFHLRTIGKQETWCGIIPRRGQVIAKPVEDEICTACRRKWWAVREAERSVPT